MTKHRMLQHTFSEVTVQDNFRASTLPGAQTFAYMNDESAVTSL